MTILQSLDGYYDRMAKRGEAEASGFSREKVSFAIVLSEEGDPVDVVDLRDLSGKTPRPRLIGVPAAVKRTAAILPNRFWDKSAYVFGRTGGEGRRTSDEHAAFKASHRELLCESNDPGLVALVRFLEAWAPARFDRAPFRPDMLDANIVFRLGNEYGFIHEREAARRLLTRQNSSQGEMCLVTGRRGPVARLHPTIKGVNGAQSSGAALVSFNLDAFSSYGKAQGANAPTSDEAAARYGEALNRMLDRGSANRLRRGIGDATVVFWADTSDTVDESAAAAAEELISLFAEPPDTNATASDDDRQEAAKLRDALDTVAEGRPVEQLDPKLVGGTRLHVLGLAPNAARLSVRFWLTDSLDTFVRRLAAHYADLRIEPKPVGWGVAPAIGRLLVRTTALQEKFENIPPLLAGEVAGAVLDGRPYPRTWLAASVIRLRAGDDAGRGWHAAAIKACLNRSPDEKEKLPVALDPARDDPAYQLGRLFAVLEAAQFAALGRVNATIGDRYYAAASSTPARVFGTLLRGLKIHAADARKRGRGGWIEPKVERIIAMLPPELPQTLKLAEQGRFAVGYYHERANRSDKILRGDEGATPDNEDAEETET